MHTVFTQYKVYAICRAGKYEVATADCLEQQEHMQINIRRYVPAVMRDDIIRGHFRKVGA